MAIIVTELDGTDRDYLISVLCAAQDNGQSVKINQHSGTGKIMVKRGGSTWTHLFGKDVTEWPDNPDTGYCGRHRQHHGVCV